MYQLGRRLEVSSQEKLAQENSLERLRVEVYLNKRWGLCLVILPEVFSSIILYNELKKNTQMYQSRSDQENKNRNHAR